MLHINVIILLLINDFSFIIVSFMEFNFCFLFLISNPIINNITSQIKTQAQIKIAQNADVNPVEFHLI